jgi:regulator of sigma E protease
MNVILVIVVFALALFVAIIIHELGHFLTARRAKVKVEEFGIGIPPRIFGIKRGETVYSVNAIPVGAFVRTAGENDPTVPRSLASKGPWTRLGVYVAGPLANVLLAFVLLSTFNALPYSVIAGNGLMVHEVTEGFPAQEAGIKAGDIILEIEGQPVSKRGDVHSIVDSVEEGKDIALLLNRDGQELEITLKPKFSPTEQRRLVGVLLLWWNMVSQVEQSSPAYAAGLRPGDAVLSVNGQLVYNHDSLSHALRSVGQDQQMNMLVLPAGPTGEATEVLLVHDGSQTVPGVEMRWVDGTALVQERLPVWRAAYEGAGFIISMPVLIVGAIPLIIRSPDMALIGPIGAGQLTVEIVSSSGFSNMLFMAGIISLGLGMFNLLPIPPLDGGGMLVAAIEGARRGRRLSPRALRLAYTVGTVFLIALVILVTFSDIRRLIIGGGFGL